MSKRSWHNDDDDDFSMPLTPMIDVVFLLLIFFLTSTILKPTNHDEQQIKIDLPGAAGSSAQTISTNKSLTIFIDRNGTIYSSRNPGHRLNDTELKALMTAHAAAGHRSVMLRADRKSDFESSATVIRLAAQSGLSVLIGYKTTARANGNTAPRKPAITSTGAP